MRDLGFSGEDGEGVRDVREVLGGAAGVGDEVEGFGTEARDHEVIDDAGSDGVEEGAQRALARDEELQIGGREEVQELERCRTGDAADC